MALGHERRILALAVLVGLPGVAAALALLWLGDFAPRTVWTATALLLLAWVGAAVLLRDQVARPLGTLANMLAALREGDFSIRARVPGGGAPDSLSLAYAEMNALESLLRNQRLGAVEATETLRKVLEEIDVAVFAFDPDVVLRIVNRAGERLLAQPADRLIGRSAAELRLAETLTGIAPRTLELAHAGGAGRWELRRSVVRQEGYPLQLIALSDLSRALREEERAAWKRIIRVLSHEINNSLAPIKSISGSLKGMLARERLAGDLGDDVERGLAVIQGRAEALGRFMASYATLARLPPPEPVDVDVAVLVRRVADLETRLPVEVIGGPSLTLRADQDQLEQALINLVRNAVDATVEAGGSAGVSIRWITRTGKLHLLVEDCGRGLTDTANLFVPFYTTKPGGSGIGLVLSRQIAEGHGGTLELENRGDGSGARARMILPLDASA
ncbi:MAG: PAS domain-containing sensor histidine kinase [Gemmatimonadetes bacterium]|nr:PAS domain-containing sensor histidine kinase [Gemmatimonadota bacterium]